MMIKSMKAYALIARCRWSKPVIHLFISKNSSTNSNTYLNERHNKEFSESNFL